MDFQNVTKYLDSQLEAGLPGMDCAVYLDHREVYRHCNGWANRAQQRPIDRTSIYQMFSMTKPITCTAMLQLYEQGAFLLEEPVAKYLPEFETMTVIHPDGVQDAQSPIRIQQLFTMTSGFGYWTESPELMKLRKEKPDYTTRDFVRALAKEPLHFEPGTHWEYGLSHDVIAALIEVLTGETFGEYLKKNIFEPLGMEDTFFQFPEEKMCRRAVRYRVTPGNPAAEAREYDNFSQKSPHHESGGAGLCATVDDYMRFADTLCGGGRAPSGERILGEHTIRMMQGNQLTEQQLHDFQNETRWGYGYGLGVRTLINPALSGSAGEVGEFGWGGAAGTYLLMDPARRLTLVYAVQSDPAPNAYLHRRLRNLVYRAIED